MKVSVSIFCFSFLVSFLFHYFSSFSWFTPYSFLSILYSLFVFVSLCFFVLLRKSKKSVTTSILTIIPVVLFFTFWPSCKIGLEDLSRSKGNQLILNIKKYELEKGHLPKNISEVTNIIERRTYLGTKFYLMVTGKKTFLLKFRSFDGMISTYYSETKEWLTDD